MTKSLVVRTVPVTPPRDLLTAAPDPAPFVWLRRGDGLVAWGEAARIDLPAGHDRFTTGEKWLRETFDAARIDDRIGLPGGGLLAFGSFTFDPASDGSVLVVPRRILGRDATGRAWLTTIDRSDDPAEHPADRGEHGCAAPHSADRAPAPAAPARGNAPTSRVPRRLGLRWHDGSLPPPKWQHAVTAAVTAIRSGKLSKVVLARDLYAATDEPIDARHVLRRLAATYPDCFTFACANLLGATPELLIRRRGRDIEALVLAGTAPRGTDPADDTRHAADLLASAKNMAEHRYAVTSVRERLGPVCAPLHIASQPQLVTLPNVHHLGTPIRGTLTIDQSALSLAATLHPTAAVCGTPTDAAMDLIRELECMDRDRYAGPVGWIDAAGNGEWGIALRCAMITDHGARLFAGNGIVADSDPATELAETDAKFRAMRQALEG